LPLEARLISGLAIAVAVVYWTTPLAIRVADRLDFHDKPRGYRGHSRPTPYLGGAALTAGFVLATLLLASGWSRTLPLVGGVVVLWIVGTWDDRREVAWWLRVIVELGLAAALWAAGLGWDLGLGGGVDLALTAFWIVAVVNAFNLFDNMDGQSATMGLVTSVGLATLGLVTGDAWLAIAATALAGACFGFLPHNLLAQPARIFLGDGGSMPLGFAVAALTMIGAADAAPAWQAIALGLLLVGVPALDTTLVVVSRRRRGISVLTGGRDHLTHRARQRLRTALAVALALGSVQIVLSLMAVAAAQGSAIWLAGAAILYLVALAVAVALIDTRIPAVPAGGSAPAPAPATDAVAPPRRLTWLPREAPLLVVLGAGAGISPWLDGYYGPGVWAPIGLALIAGLLALAIARPPRPGAVAWVTLAAIAGLGLWALASVLWADSIEQAVVGADRWLALAAFLGVCVLLVRDRRTALWALGSAGAAVLAVQAWQVVKLLGPGAAEQFLGGRLDQPLGYINAQATFSILGMWLLMALAEQRRSAAAAGAGLAGATVCAGLVLLSQSRGAGLAVAGSALVVLALVPGRQRRAFALGLLLVVVVMTGGSLLDVGRDGTATAGDVNGAMVTLLLAAAGAGVLWGLAVAAVNGLEGRARQTAQGVATGALVAAVVVAGMVAVVRNDAIRDQVRTQYDAFVTLAPAAGGEQTASRLLSGAGNRYDYWQIAGNVWQADPVLGVGAGNYDQEYFLRRSTVEDVRQPHSLGLQALSELGIPGLALTLLFLAGVVAGALRWRAAARASRTERALLVAGLGTFSAWAVHTQVDWIHLLPGITAIALMGAAVLLRRPQPVPADRRMLAPAPRALVAALIVLPVAIAGVSLSRQVLSQHYAGDAREALAAGEAEDALRAADRALRLDRETLSTYYTKAAAFARLGDAEAAEGTLLQAVRVEPGDFLTYALLGDLSVRRRDFSAASGYYLQAAARNPREPALAELVENPRAAAP
jgi:UDP-GlcNAc:undecaprenyl-phosphate/decaprenyl-phosphate GlcNAc-1-phosphate transferase